MRVTNDGVAGDGLHLAAAGGVQLGLALGGVVLEVLDADERRGELVGPVVGGGLLLGRLVVGPDDERGSGLVDQDAVGLVDDRVMVGALDGHLRLRCALPRPRNACSKVLRWRAAELQPLQLVAEEVEAELLAGAVSDVAGIGGAPAPSDCPVWMQPTVMPEQLVDRRSSSRRRGGRGSR